MTFFRLLPAIVFLASSISMQAEAAGYPTFTIDFTQSSVDVTPTSACSGDCGITATFAEPSVSMQFDHVGDRHRLRDIIEWSFDNASSISSGLYDVAVNLVFTSPDVQSTTHTGTSHFATFYGIVSQGILSWDRRRADVMFDQGSELAVMFQTSYEFAFGSTLNTQDILIQALTLAPMEAPSPAPVPPALPIMILAIGAMVYMGRRQVTIPRPAAA